MDLKEIAVKAARKAGKHALKNFRKIKNVSFKKGKEIVTNVDLECEKIIKDILLSSFPEHNYLGEERGKIEGTSEYTWIVDPIDGTVNFARGIGLYGISIALAKRKEIVFGVVYNPISNELFIAEKGKGAFLNDEKISVSSINNLDNSLVFVTPLNKMKSNYIKVVESIKQARIITSTAYEICQIAAGRVDGAYKVSRNCWGFSAACLIVEEAGGKVTDFEGERWNIDSRQLVVSNGKIHNKLLNILS